MTTTATTTLDAKDLLAKLRPWVDTLVDDMRPRYAADADLRNQHQQATAARRTADAFAVWLEDELTQAAVAWVLAGAFVRFLEDQGFIDPLLTGPGDRQARAAEAEARYFGAHPTAGFTDLWLHIFNEMAQFRATHMLFDRAHGMLWRLAPSGDASQELLRFWRAQDPDVGGLALRFDDKGLDTRFLGDLYQDLSEAARKRFALLQTPDFVEAFILDRTLEPAVSAYGLDVAALIDPTCGSGHFVLGAFQRLLGHWERLAPGLSRREQVLKALGAVAGVDLNPFAIAIARFRLVVAAMRAEGLQRLADAPDYDLSLAVGDTLLCAPTGGQQQLFGLDVQRNVERLPRGSKHEDLELLARVFSRQYAAVVGNPPYIQVKDKALSQAYRERYPDACHRQYSLGVPFTEVFFRLALPGDASGRAGFVGMITTNTFMKREFGKKLIEQVLPKLDLTHVISTADAYLPGHGTPTAILLGRHRLPTTRSVRVVMGIQGEDGVPSDPARGLVWMSILELLDNPGSESDFVSVLDFDRDALGKHPWSIGGGGAVELKAAIEGGASAVVGDLAHSIGFMCITKADDIFVDYLGKSDPELVSGEDLRDWTVSPKSHVFFPYSSDGQLIKSLSHTQLKALFPFRVPLESRAVFGGATFKEAGRSWWEYGQIPRTRLEIKNAIAFAYVATHNHFTFERGGKVFKQSAPMIKLPLSATKEDHLGLLGVLNSSAACFWLMQVCHNKHGSGDGKGMPQAWMDRYEFDGTKVAALPVPTRLPLELARELDFLAAERQAHTPERVLKDRVDRAILADARRRTLEVHGRMVALQEELDWQCYALYGILDEPPICGEVPDVACGERAFEIVLARRVASGEEQSRWFTFHGFQPVTEIPSRWPDAYRTVVERRIHLIESDPSINLIEQPNYKRRWHQPTWEDLEQAALRSWILDRLETPTYWRDDPNPCFQTVRELATAAVADPELQLAVDLFTRQAGADLYGTLAALVQAEAVPYIPALRYTESGARKRAVWEDTWALQRREDAGEEVGKIPVPPKYKPEDFRHKDYWRLRDALDVPKERFISLPGAEKLPDNALVVGWAGWNHLQRAQALVGHYLWARDEQAWDVARLLPLLAGLVELEPWLFQWHHDIDPSTGSRPSEDVAAFLEAELSHHGLAREALSTWRPVEMAVKRGRKKT